MQRSDLRDEEQIVEILDKAHTLFAKYGLKRTTMEDIAKAMGKSKSSLYYYFEKKQEIFEEIVLRQLKELQREIATSLHAKGTARDKLKGFVDAWFGAMRRKAEIYEAVKLEAYENVDSMDRLRAQFELAGLELIRTIVQEGIREGQIKPFAQEQTDLFAHAFLAMLWWAKFPIFAGHGMHNIEPQMHTMIDLLMEGMEVKP